MFRLFVSLFVFWPIFNFACIGLTSCMLFSEPMRWFSGLSIFIKNPVSIGQFEFEVDSYVGHFRFDLFLVFMFPF